MAATALAVGEEHLGFVRRYIFSTDHKVIGLQYLLTALAMAVVGGGLSFFIRLQLAWPAQAFPWLASLFPRGAEGGILKPEFYNALITMHGTIMILFVVAVALTSGFGNYLIPLQIGARDMAFPFLNMLSYWVYFLSCVILVASFFVPEGAAASGWTAYPPLSALPGAAPGCGWGQTLWILSAALFILAATMTSLNIITTVLILRAPGMGMGRLPLSTWAIFISAIINLLAFPPLLAAGILLLLDRHLGTSFFVPGDLVLSGQPVLHEGGIPLLWQHLFWFLGHPEVYVIILPAMGIAAELLTTFARKPIYGYRVIVGSMVAIAFIGFIAWGHHMYTSGMNPLLGFAFMIPTVAIGIPSTIIMLCLLATLWKGRIRFTPPMLFGLGFLSAFGTGGLGGIFLGSAPTDIYLHDTYFVVGHFHFTIAASPLFAIFGGIYYWFPKMFGRRMNETLAKIHFWLTFISFYLVFFPMHITGVGGMPRRYYAHTAFAYLEPHRWLEVFISLAAFVLLGAQILFLLNFFGSLWWGRRAEENPWRANTLEWQAATPPPHGNWGPQLPVVHRWPYDYSLPDAPEDFVPQTTPGAAEPSFAGSGQPIVEPT